MQIAVVGTGCVGGALGKGWAKVGHEVIFATRDPQSSKVEKLLQESRGATALGVAHALGAAHIIALATPFTTVEGILRSAGNLGGKTLIDCTNPIAPGLELALGHTTSGAEQIAGWAQDAHVVKCFNTTGWENMVNPVYGSMKATMFLCGDHENAKHQVVRLAEELGFEACDTGPLKTARYLEPLAMVWIQLARVQGQGSGIAFKLIRR